MIDAATAVRYAIALPTMYSLMSLNEYATHRYFQHLEFNKKESLPAVKRAYRALTGAEEDPKMSGDGHVEHHAETFDDMSLKNDERWRKTPASQSLDDDEFRGTAFHWKATAIMTLQMAPSVFPTYALMGWSAAETTAILLPCMLVHAAIWNAIHPPMHGLPPVTARSGVPSSWLAGPLSETWYWKFIYENHMGHHVLGGQANYNVCCPMTDHLLGTYVPTAEWAGRMRAIPDGASTRGAPVGPQGVPQPPAYVPRSERQGSEGDEGVAVLAGGGAIIADAYSQ
jgi:hypothetical protein